MPLTKTFEQLENQAKKNQSKKVNPLRQVFLHQPTNTLYKQTNQGIITSHSGCFKTKTKT